MSENTDRRVRMTKALLRDTLAELMAEKPISKIYSMNRRINYLYLKRR